MSEEKVSTREKFASIKQVILQRPLVLTFIAVFSFFTALFIRYLS
ncbi:hypothetical protein [Halorubrum sp. BV1]|nr:hypothetical protein [Halorubrum sp. BV1]